MENLNTISALISAMLPRIGMLRLLKILVQARLSEPQVLARVDHVIVTSASSDLPSFNLQYYLLDSGLDTLPVSSF